MVTFSKGSGEETEKRCNQSEPLSPEIHATPMNSNQTEKSSQKQSKFLK